MMTFRQCIVVLLLVQSHSAFAANLRGLQSITESSQPSAKLASPEPTTAPTTDVPTRSPITRVPTDTPTRDLTPSPTKAPTRTPTGSPTTAPTDKETDVPSVVPSLATAAPSQAPTVRPSFGQTAMPSHAPSEASNAPSLPPTTAPTIAKTDSPSQGPSLTTGMPSFVPTIAPTVRGTPAPSPEITLLASGEPTISGLIATLTPTILSPEDLTTTELSMEQLNLLGLVYHAFGTDNCAEEEAPEGTPEQIRFFVCVRERIHFFNGRSFVARKATVQTEGNFFLRIDVVDLQRGFPEVIHRQLCSRDPTRGGPTSSTFDECTIELEEFLAEEFAPTAAPTMFPTVAISDGQQDILDLVINFFGQDICSTTRQNSHVTGTLCGSEPFGAFVQTFDANFVGVIVNLSGANLTFSDLPPITEFFQSACVGEDHPSFSKPYALTLEECLDTLTALFDGTISAPPTNVPSQAPTIAPTVAATDTVLSEVPTEEATRTAADVLTSAPTEVMEGFVGSVIP